ncbi:MAG TPA: restriction endonuclease [Phycisphaerales bacterium]|nr:restriction endonuclease [Phycisphaerales bacterium]
MPEEIGNQLPVFEGAVRSIRVNVFERNPQARRQCVEHYGRSCCICGFNFAVCYGDPAVDYIQVHHLRALSEIGERYEVDPVRDLRPVCPNCHAVLHLRAPSYTIEEVKEMIRTRCGSI